MHRVIAGCNLWSLLFLLAALVLGARHAPGHVPVGIFAAVFALLAQSAIFALFMGASKLLKEHVGPYALDRSLLERTNALMFPLFRRASLGAMSVLLMAILSGLAASGDVASWIHVVAGIATAGVLAAVLPGEVRLLSAMHDVLADMERSLPDRAPGQAAPAPPAAGGDPGGRALVFVGTTALAMVLGYRFISGIALPSALVWTVCLLAVLCLVLAGIRHRRTAASDAGEGA